MFGTEMSPGLLLMCKLLFVLLLAHGFHENLRDPFVPFVPALDHFRSVPGVFGATLKVAFFGAGLCLLSNYRVRGSAVVLGVAVLLALLASKPGYRNHILVVGCLFFLAGLHRRGEEPWLVSAQLVVVYAGAFLSKALDPDWWSGQFMHNWLHTDLANPYYEFLYPLLPGRTFAVIVSWAVIASELALAVLFAVRHWHRWAVASALAMHLVFFIVVGRRVFGHFLEDMVLAMLAFLHWPEGQITVRARGAAGRVLGRVLPFANWDRQFELGEPLPRGDRRWFSSTAGATTRADWRGLWQFLRYNAAFYVAAFCVFNGTAFAISRLRHLI